VHHSISQMKHQHDATLCRFYFSRVTLHVSGASAHHQEYLKLVRRPLVGTCVIVADKSSHLLIRAGRHLVGFSYPHWITMHGQPHNSGYINCGISFRRSPASQVRDEYNNTPRGKRAVHWSVFTRNGKVPMVENMTHDEWKVPTVENMTHDEWKVFAHKGLRNRLPQQCLPFMKHQTHVFPTVVAVYTQDMFAQRDCQQKVTRTVNSCITDGICMCSTFAICLCSFYKYSSIMTSTLFRTGVLESWRLIFKMHWAFGPAHTVAFVTYDIWKYWLNFTGCNMLYPGFLL